MTQNTTGIGIPFLWFCTQHLCIRCVHRDCMEWSVSALIVLTSLQTVMKCSVLNCVLLFTCIFKAKSFFFFQREFILVLFLSKQLRKLLNMHDCASGAFERKSRLLQLLHFFHKLSFFLYVKKDKGGSKWKIVYQCQNKKRIIFVITEIRLKWK